MLKLPNLEKSANLLIELSHNRIVTKLAYTDYDIGRHYVLSDILSPVPSLLTSEFLKDYISAVEKQWDWQFFRNSSDQVMPFTNEGFGLDSINVYVDSRHHDGRRLLEVIREVSKDITIITMDNSYIQDLLLGVANKLGYEDVLLLDMGLEDTFLYRLKRDKQRNSLSQPLSTGYKFNHGKVQLGNEWRLIDSVLTPKSKAFLQYETTSSRLSNMWANYVLGERKATGSKIVKDILRSFSTLQNLTIRNDNKGVFDGVGEMKYSTLLLITGSVPRQLEYKDILLSVIDGLEINNCIDLGIDYNNSILSLGKAYATGIAKSGFFAEFTDFVDRLDQILVPDVAVEGGTKRVIFTANIQNVNGDNRDVYALSNEISQIMVDRDVDIQEISGEFIKSSSIYSEFKYGLIVGKKKYNSVIIDSRYRPIVYGPEPKNNNIKISGWINASVL